MSTLKAQTSVATSEGDGQRKKTNSASYALTNGDHHSFVMQITVKEYKLSSQISLGLVQISEHLHQSQPVAAIII